MEDQLPTLIERVDRLLADNDSTEALYEAAIDCVAVPDKLAAVCLAAVKGWIQFEQLPSIVKDSAFKDYLEYFLPGDSDSSFKKGFFSY